MVNILKVTTLREVRGISLVQNVDKDTKETNFFIDNGWEVSETFDEVIKDELLNIEDDAQFVAVCQAYL